MIAAEFTPIQSAVVGDRATLPDARGYIRASCHSVDTVMLGCLPCRKPLANLVQLHWHLESAPDSTHVIARLCGEHGWETL